MNKIRVAGLTIAATTAVVAVAGCGLGEGVTESSNGHVKTVSYTSGTEGKNNAEARLPGWVPVEAKSVTEVIRTTGSERILRYTSVGVPSTCSPGPAATAAATLTASWWPHGQEGKADRVCDQDWHVFVEGDTVYAFRPETIEHGPAS